jgi:hypothetical protein
MFRRKLVISALFFVFVATFASLSFYLTKKTDSASLTSASTTLANSRMSYKAGVATGSSGSSVVTIDAAANPDITTNHLFPGDVVCFTDAGQNGCIGNTTYTVSSVAAVDGVSFNLTTPLGANLDTSGYVIATQSGGWTVSFTTVAQVPIGGSLVVTVPMADNTVGNNAIPDHATDIATGGFDLGRLGPSNVIVSAGCTPTSWGSTGLVTSIATGSATTDHVFTWTRAGSICSAASAITVTVGGPGIVNPAPKTSGHTQGTADIYGITVQTKDSGGNVIDSAIPRAAPVEAVLISGTVDESLSFVVASLAGGAQTYCGSQTYILSSATSIPWGHFAATNTFYYSAQQLTVSTNAASGYVVTIEENDQMGKNGNTCTGTAPSAGDYTFSAGTCIRDTVCASSNCSESVASDWITATSYPGLGYSLATVSASPDAPFFYNEKTRTWSAKQLADKTQGGETAATIMSNVGPVNASSIYVCYKITIPGTQPSGYYYNIAKYTATATF